jgi:hypothetical protein
VIFQSHRFVHQRSRFARGDLGRGHSRLVVAFGQIYGGNGYGRSAANLFVALLHAANRRSYKHFILVEIDFQLPSYLFSAFLFFHD